MNTLALLGLAGGIALVYFVYRSGLLSLLYDAEIGSVGIDVVALSCIKLFTLPYLEIENVREVGFRGQFSLRALNLSNRSLGKAFLVVRKKSSYGRPMLITPANVLRFKTVLAENGIKCT